MLASKAALMMREDSQWKNLMMIWLTMLMVLSGSALANPTAVVKANSLAQRRSAPPDPAAVVKAHSDAFGRAFNSCDIPALLDLYADNAVLIWPGEGEVASGKEEIAKVLKAECSRSSKSSLKQTKSDSRAIGANYIINIGMWDDTMLSRQPMILRVRTTELLHRSDGKWRYVIDHASVGSRM